VKEVARGCRKEPIGPRRREQLLVVEPAAWRRGGDCLQYLAEAQWMLPGPNPAARRTIEGRLAGAAPGNRGRHDCHS
jgi:hypothetical protein